MLPSAKMHGGKDLPPKAVTFYQNDWCAFISDQILKLSPAEIRANKPGRRLEPEQIEIITSLQNNKKTAAVSGHGIGKSSSIAFSTITYIYLFPYAQVIITGPKYDNLKNTVWKEIGIWLDRSKMFGDQLVFQAEKMYHIYSPETWYACMATSGKAENITGIHGDHVMILVDEASAEAIDAIFDGILGCITKDHNRLGLFGNPTRTSGVFFDAFHGDRNLYQLFRYNSEESRLVTPGWLADQKEKYHPESDMYRVRVLGQFPRGNENAIISQEQCTNAVSREVPAGNYIEVGIDPAGQGQNFACIVIRVGMKMDQIIKKAECTPSQLYWAAIQGIRDCRKKTGIKSKIRVKIDAGGGFGDSIIENMANNTDDNVEPIAVHFNGKATNSDYSNYGSQMWFEMAESIDEAQLIDNQWLIEDLSTRETNHDDLSKRKIEPKQKQKDRIHRSPDTADATVLCYAKGHTVVFSRGDESSANIRNFEIDWTNDKLRDPTFDGLILTSCIHLAAFAMTKDLQLYGLAAFFQYYTNKLWLYHEFHYDVPVPDVVARDIKYKCNKGFFRGSDNDLDVKIIGGNKLFREDSGRRAYASVLRQHQVSINPTKNYDEYGAIALGTDMFKKNNVVMHKRMTSSISQISLWTIKNSRTETETLGYCKAFLLLMSRIKREIKPLNDAYPKYRDYKPKPEKKEKKKSTTAWMKR